MFTAIRLTTIAAVIGLLCFADAPVQAQSSIRLLVNDQPVTSFDISQRSRLRRLARLDSSESATIDELIEETLKDYEALKRGVSVPEDRVDSAYASIAKGFNMSVQEFTRALNSEGIESTSLKKKLRSQMTWDALVQRRMRAESAAVKGSDIMAALQSEEGAQAQTLTEYILQPIVFVVPSGSSAGQYAQRRREATAFRDRFKGCDQILDQAKQLRGVVVKERFRRDSSQLQGQGGQDIQETAPGKMAPPHQTDQGIELMAVCSKREFQSTGAARSAIENKLFLEQNSDLGEEYLAELKERAIIERR
jgi:peptidyl-prolyl cis-trans isomerase SurA